MKFFGIKYCNILKTVVPALMLVLLLASIGVSAFHNHQDCANPDNCAICTFQVSSCTLSLDAASGSNSVDEPVFLSFSNLPERVSLPFHTHIFASHAPPQFC
jgi:hypothetical protein